MTIKPDPVTGYLPPGFRRQPVEQPRQPEPTPQEIEERKWRHIPVGMRPPGMGPKPVPAPPPKLPSAGTHFSVGNRTVDEREASRRRARQAGIPEHVYLAEERDRELRAVPIQQVLDEIRGTGRRIWRDGDAISVDPPLTTDTPRLVRLIQLVVLRKAELLPLLSPEQPAAQRF